MKEIFQQFIVFVKNQIAEGFFNVRIDNPNDIVDPIKQSTDKISQTLLDIAKDKGVNESFNSDVVDGLSKLEEAINSKQFPEIPKEIIVSNLQGIIEAIKESIQEPPKVEVNFDEKKIVSSLSKIEKKLSVKTIEEIDYTPILSELCDLVENSKTVIDLKNVEILLAEIFSKPSLPIENDRVKVILPDEQMNKLGKVMGGFYPTDHALKDSKGNYIDPAIKSEQISTNSKLDTLNSKVATEDTLQSVAGFNIPKYDYVSRGWVVGTFTETWTFKTGGSGGITVGTLTIVYDDVNQSNIISVAKT